MNTKLARRRKSAVLAWSLAAFAPSVFAQLNLPFNDGSDGPLVVTNSTMIDLGQAVTGSWTNTSASPGKGTYDPNQWAVVFKYSSVVISNGGSVSFLNNATHAPVVWLVAGDVTIGGSLSLDGQSGASSGPNLAEPGPGGFRGGGGDAGQGNGFGPGGGGYTFTGSGGAYLNAYGSEQIVPLIGGSGGGSGEGRGGGGGGGAILIAASGAINLNGSCHANGGDGGSNAGGGSGGGIRLVASQISGSGAILALGGGNFVGGPGRIRLEGTDLTGLNDLSALNPTPTTLTLTPGGTPLIFPDTTAPTVSVIGVVASGVTNIAPADPHAALVSSGNDDLRIVTTNQVTILVQTMNFPTNGNVIVYIKPRNGYNDSTKQVFYPATLASGDVKLATWQVAAYLPYPPSSAHTIIQARAYQ